MSIKLTARKADLVRDPLVRIFSADGTLVMEVTPEEFEEFGLTEPGFYAIMPDGTKVEA